MQCCHDLTMLGDNIGDIAIIIIKNIDYHCIIHNISRSEAINLLENSVLEDRMKTSVLEDIYEKYCLHF